jgi:hypothetical protein
LWLVGVLQVPPPQEVYGNNCGYRGKINREAGIVSVQYFPGWVDMIRLRFGVGLVWESGLQEIAAIKPSKHSDEVWRFNLSSTTHQSFLFLKHYYLEIRR